MEWPASHVGSLLFGQAADRKWSCTHSVSGSKHCNDVDYTYLHQAHIFPERFEFCLQDVKVPCLQHMSKSLQAYWKSMWPVLCFSWQQAIALPTGIHAEFAKYGIDAITIRTDMHSHEVYQKMLYLIFAALFCVYVTTPAVVALALSEDGRLVQLICCEPCRFLLCCTQVAWSYGLEEGIIKLAVLFELTMRSLNNLLEQFHHSTTFFVLISPDWHVPFQAHIVPPLLLIFVLVLQVTAVCPTVHVKLDNQQPGQQNE